MLRLIKMGLNSLLGDGTEDIDGIDTDDVDDVDDIDSVDDVDDIIGEIDGADVDVDDLLTGGITTDSVSDEELSELTEKKTENKHYRSVSFTGIKGCNICRMSRCPRFTPVSPESEWCICGHNKNDHEWG
jgi:hypothetical protein